MNDRGSIYSSESSLNKSYLVPHPPHQPKSSSNELSMVRYKQYHPRNQSSDSKSNHSSSSFDNREIKSAGSSTNSKNLKNKNELTKSTSKISSAPSRRTFQMEKNSGLYQFGSKPQSVTTLIKKDPSQLLPDHPKKKSNLKTEPSPPPPINTTSIWPCLSQASPIIPDAANKLHKVNRRAIQKMPMDKLKSRIAKSLPESTVTQIMTLSKNSIAEEESCHLYDSISENNNEISKGVMNWGQFHLPNNVSDSFEEKMLASLTAKCTLGEEKVIPLLLSQFFKSKENINHSSHQQFPYNQPPHLLNKNGNSQMHNSSTNKKVITPRTEALIGSSYSDEESSQLTTGGLSNTGPSPLATIDSECCCCCNNVSSLRKSQNTQDNIDNGSALSNQICNVSSAHNIAHDSQCRTNNASNINLHPSNNYPHHNSPHMHNPRQHPDLHNEWKHQINCSQDTDFQDMTTDFTASTSMSSNSNEFLSVYYMHDFDCFYDPATGVFYESNITKTKPISAV